MIIVLGFIFEFLLAFAAKSFISWSEESNYFLKIISRLKKLIAGNYFPLSLLSLSVLNLSLFLPFAYSFFVPTQLYLGKLSLDYALRGLLVQIFWILVLYTIIIKVIPKKKKIIA